MSNTMLCGVFRQALSRPAQQIDVFGVQSRLALSRQLRYTQIKRAGVVGTHSPFIIGIHSFVTVYVSL